MDSIHKGDDIPEIVTFLSVSPMFGVLLKDFREPRREARADSKDFALVQLCARMYMAGRLSIALGAFVKTHTTGALPGAGGVE